MLYLLLVLYIKAVIAKDLIPQQENVTWVEAQRVCYKDGGTLPDITHIDELIRHMKEHNIDSVWLGLEKQPLSEPQWMDHTPVDRELRSAGKIDSSSECGYVNMIDSYVDMSQCDATVHGVLCEKQGCKRCDVPPGITCDDSTNPGTCYIIDYQANKNWYQARTFCTHYGYDLIKIPNRPMIINVLDKLMKKSTHNLRSFWVGMAMFSLNIINPSVSAGSKAENISDPEYPCVSLVNKKNGFIWESASCQNKNNFYCLLSQHQATKNSTENASEQYTTTAYTQTGEPTAGLHKGKIAAIVISPIIIIVIIILACYCLIQRARTKRNNSRTPKENGSSAETLPMVTGGEDQPQETVDAPDGAPVADTSRNDAVPPDRPITQDEKEAAMQKIISQYKECLVEKINFKNTTLWEVLISKGVVTHSDAEEVKETKKSNRDQVRYLLDHLMKHPDQFEPFIKALIEKQQSHIVKTYFQEYPGIEQFL